MTARLEERVEDLNKRLITSERAAKALESRVVAMEAAWDDLNEALALVRAAKKANAVLEEGKAIQ